jgi:hypothetical protein
MMRVVFIEVWTSSIRLDYNAEQNGERTGTARQSHPLVGLSYLQRGGRLWWRTPEECSVITGHRAEKRERLMHYRRQRCASERKVKLAARDKGSVKVLLRWQRTCQHRQARSLYAVRVPPACIT